MIFLLLLALMPTPAPQVKPWVPADTGTQDCGMDYHRHSLILDEHGHYVVDKQKGEPDIVFDGKCHDEQERVAEPRRALPVPTK